MQDGKTDMLLNPRCRPGAGRQHDGNQGGCLVLSHITLGGIRSGPDAAWCRVIHDSCRTCAYRRKRLGFLPFPRLMCPVFPESSCQILVMLRAGLAGSKFVIELG
jgi:hypothetical protein